MGSCVSLGMIASQASCGSIAACLWVPSSFSRSLTVPLSLHSPPTLLQLWSFKLLRDWGQQHRRGEQLAATKKQA